MDAWSEPDINQRQYLGEVSAFLQMDVGMSHEKVEADMTA